MSMSLMTRETLKPDSDIESSVPGEGEEEKERYKDEVKQKEFHTHHYKILDLIDETDADMPVL